MAGRASDAAASRYTVREAKALHEVGVTNHGWYMTEAEHRGVLDVIARMESALLYIADHQMTGTEQTLHIDFQGKAREALRV